MSQAFYQKFLHILFGFFLLLIFLFANSEFLILYLLSPGNLFYYYGYVVLLVGSGIFGIKYYREYHGFRESISQGLFEEKPVNHSELEPISEIPDDKSLAVCAYYRNGASLDDIKKNLGLSHPMQVRRYLIKGIDVLLKEHMEKKKT